LSLLKSWQSLSYSCNSSSFNELLLISVITTARLWTLFWDITIIGQVENGTRRHEGIRGSEGTAPYILALATRWWVVSSVGTVNGCVEDSRYWFTLQGKCICLFHSATVPHCPFVTVPLCHIVPLSQCLSGTSVAVGRFWTFMTSVAILFYILQLYLLHTSVYSCM
jgi:hypothetical protein